MGKWHLGHYRHEFQPLQRGFDSHIGFWTGHQDYFDHTAMEKDMWGLDMRQDSDVAYDMHGQYTTDIISRESVAHIRRHGNSSAAPLFLYVAHAAVHSGNPYNPLPAPDETVAKMEHISDYHRRRFAAMMKHMDDSVGAIVAALDEQRMLSNSVIVFSTDNGGPAEGFNLNAASNWPLRGVKNTLWEGGVRGAALVWGGRHLNGNRVSSQRMHIADWLPTLIEAAGGGSVNVSMDGLSLWPALLSSNVPSSRTEILHNIDDIWGSAALTMDDWKVLKGTNYMGEWDGWYGPAGDRGNDHYNLTAVRTSAAAQAMKRSSIELPTDESIKLVSFCFSVKLLSNVNVFFLEI